MTEREKLARKLFAIGMKKKCEVDWLADKRTWKGTVEQYTGTREAWLAIADYVLQNFTRRKKRT